MIMNASIFSRLRPGSSRLRLAVSRLCLGATLVPSLALAAPVDTAPGAVVGAAEPALVDPHPEDRIVVRVDPALEDAPLVRKWLDDEARTQLEQANVDLLPKPGDARRLIIEVGGTSYDFQYRLGISEDSSGSAQPWESCACSYEELIATVGARVQSHVPALRAASVDASPAPAPAPAIGRDSVLEPASDRPLGPQRRPLKPLGRAGIGLLVPGIVLSAAGGGLIAVGERRDRSAGDLDSDQIDYRPPGGAALGVGLATAVTGVVLLIVDRVRGRQAVAFTPGIGPRSATSSVTIRF